MTPRDPAPDLKFQNAHSLAFGPFWFGIETNVPGPRFGDYIGAAQYGSLSVRADRTIRAYDTGDAEVSEGLLALADGSWRARAMRHGYYAGETFGRPVALFERDGVSYVVGKRLPEIIWRYHVKLYLSTLAYESGMLHLKAGAVKVGEFGYLIISPGAGGKTTLLHELMEHDAELISNTHVVISHRTIHGIHSTIRFRQRPHRTRFDFERATVGSRESGETNVDPVLLYGRNRLAATSSLNGILLLERAAGDKATVERVNPADVTAVMAHFAAPITTYNLKHDMFEYAGRSYARYSKMVHSMERRLEDLCASVPVYLLRVNALSDASAECALKILRSGLATNE